MKEGFSKEFIRIQIYSTPNEIKYSLQKGINFSEKRLDSTFQELRLKYQEFLKPAEVKSLEEYQLKDGTVIQVYPINLVYGAKPWPQAKILDIQTPKTPQGLARFLKKSLGLEVKVDIICKSNFNLA